MEKSIITFSANEQNLQKTGGIGCYASDTVSYIEAHFALGENWSGYDSIRAVWFNDYKTISTVLDYDGVCIVPHEVLANRGKVMVNLVGSVLVSDELSDRLTTFPCEALKVSAKAKISGSETAAVTPSQFEQFVSIVISEVEKVTGMTAQAETLPAGSQATARYENGILYLGIPQGIQGERGETGADGNGIASVVYNADYSLTLIFDNGEQLTTPPIRGERGPAGADGRDGTDGRDGADGVTPSLSVGTVTTLPSTEDAYVTRTGTDENPVFNFGIPQGPKGDKGDTGEVSQAEFDEAVSDLKSDLNLVGVRKPTYTVTHGKAMTTQTTSLVDSSMFSIADPIALNKGERISVTCSTFATTFGIIAVCNADNTSRQIIVNSDGNDNTRYHYTAKEDCYVCLLLRDSDTSPNIIIDERIPERVDVVQTSLEYDETFIKELLAFKDIPLTIAVGSFYNSNVVYTAYANNDFQTAELTVEDGKYYHIHASCSFGNTIYAFLDSNNLVIEKVLDTTGTAAGTVVDVAVKAPLNATTLRVGTCKGSGTLSVGIADGVVGVKPYSGTTWAVFGDSLTEVNATAAKKYYDWLSEKYGMSIVNYGASGTGYRSSYDDGKAFYQRMANIDPDAFDFLTIFGSGNDIKYLKNGTFPLGTANDYGNLNADPATLGSAINRTIEQYHALCPTKPIGLITPTPWFAYCTGWRMNRDDAVLMQNYADLIKEIGYIRGIPVLDLFNCSNLRPWDATNRLVYYNENGVQDGGTHPNSAGHKLIASQFDTFIHSIYFVE